jgi:hypothetical protein
LAPFDRLLLDDGLKSGGATPGPPYRKNLSEVVIARSFASFRQRSSRLTAGRHRARGTRARTIFPYDRLRGPGGRRK